MPLTPVGPEPSMVYWLRRGSIAIIALVVIVGLWWLLGSRGSSDTPAPVASASAIASTLPSAPSSLAPMPTPTASGDAVSSAPAADPGASEAVVAGEILDCKNSDISVVASTDKDSYKVGAKPQLTMTIQNIGAVACKRDVGPKANSLEITSGGYHVWSSDDCGAGTQSKIITLKPGKKVGTGIEWNGRVTTKGCPTKGTPAKAGRYQVTGKNLKAKSPAATFSLTK
ncbi:MAG: hypothetical protein ACR2JS_00460 [Candidatus Nanopelagicales bacterium]